MISCGAPRVRAGMDSELSTRSVSMSGIEGTAVNRDNIISARGIDAGFDAWKGLRPRVVRPLGRSEGSMIKRNRTCCCATCCPSCSACPADPRSTSDMHI